MGEKDVFEICLERLNKYCNEPVEDVFWYSQDERLTQCEKCDQYFEKVELVMAQGFRNQHVCCSDECVREFEEDVRVGEMEYRSGMYDDWDYGMNR
jgi:hypothetical protein